MADATDSKSVVRKGVWVQLPPRAQRFDAYTDAYTKHGVASPGHSFYEQCEQRAMSNVSIFSGRLVERRLLRGSLTLRRLREELHVVDEQLEMLTDDAADKELRSLVAETPYAAFEHRDAQGHVEALNRHRDHIFQDISDLELRQDSLLDRLGLDRLELDKLRLDELGR